MENYVKNILIIMLMLLIFKSSFLLEHTEHSNGDLHLSASLRINSKYRTYSFQYLPKNLSSCWFYTVCSNYTLA